MNAEDLYAHWWDCTYCETGAGEVGEREPGWEDLSEAQRKGWNALAECIRKGRGMTIRWPYEPARIPGGEA